MVVLLLEWITLKNQNTVVIHSKSILIKLLRPHKFFHELKEKSWWNDKSFHLTEWKQQITEWKEGRE